MGENRFDLRMRLFWTYISAAFFCLMAALAIVVLGYQAPQPPAPAVHINGWRGDG